MDLSGTGVWSGALRFGDRENGRAAAELESLGYSALWIPGGAGGDIFGDWVRSSRPPSRSPSPRGSSTSGCTSPPTWQPATPR